MRSPSSLLAPVVVLLAVACGGEDLPTLDVAVAEELAGRADVLAGQLEAGDACGARETAGGLVTVTSEARDAGTVPVAVAREVIATTRDLVRDVTCAPEPEPEPEPAPPAGEDDRDEDGQGEGKGEDKGEGKAKGKDGDEDDDKDDD